MTALRVAVVGAAGRMGRAACEWIDAANDLELVARVGAGDDLAAALRASECAVAVDLTRAPQGFDHAVVMLDAGVRPVIGTSGVDAAQCTALDERARSAGLGGIVVPNFSLGAMLLQRAAEDVARHLRRFEVLEMHHERKADAPSGTARFTADRLAEAAGIDPADVAIHSMRLPGVHANQEVVFGAEGEWLRLRHETFSRETYRAGLLASVRYAREAVGVARGLGAAWDAAGGRTAGGGDAEKRADGRVGE